MTSLNVLQKIVEVRKVASGFSKDSKSYGYSYVSGNQILGKIKDKMNELGLLLIPSVGLADIGKHEYKNNKGKDCIDFVLSGSMRYTWVNADDPADKLEVDWSFYGQQDDVSKAFGSALTYSERYFLLKCLGLPTDEDDPDDKANSTRRDPDGDSQSEPIVSEGQLKRLYAISKSKDVKYDDVKKVAMKDYGKALEVLTVSEYNALVERISKK